MATITVLGNLAVDDPSSGSHAATKTYVDDAKYAENIGDGSTTSFTITHNLGSQDVFVTIREVASPYGDVQIDGSAVTVQYDSANAIGVDFSAAPSTDQYRVIVRS